MCLEGEDRQNHGVCDGSACEAGALAFPVGVAGASTFVGFVHGLSGSGSCGFGGAARPGAAAIITAAVVIAATRAVLCVLRARRNGVRVARECINFPHRKTDTATPTVTADSQSVT
ncbi:hypothetical protein ABTZ21_17240 [Streptomyces sp. NPDC096191]|uniref:hypothetical protein n=1 Tax=Streptomyces sp. NPDC096191 TaxID=3155426 RepID=UPI0033297BEE